MKNISTAQDLDFFLTINELPGVEFWLQDVTTPAFNLTETILENPLSAIMLSGDKPEFDPITFNFILDKQWNNYVDLFNYMYDSVDPFDASKRKEIKFDATITIVDALKVPIVKITFIDCVPTVLDGVTLNLASDNPQPILSAVTVRFLTMQMEKI